MTMDDVYQRTTCKIKKTQISEIHSGGNVGVRLRPYGERKSRDERVCR